MRRYDAIQEEPSMTPSYLEDVELSALERSSGVIVPPVAEVIPDFSVLWPKEPSRRGDTHQKFKRVREEVLAESLMLVSPRAVWAKVAEADAVRVVSPGVPDAILEKTDVFIGVICTIGGDLDARVQHYFQTRESTRGYFLDQVGSLAVASLAQRAALRLCDGHSAVRWAPGDYDGDWALSAQRELFDRIPGEHIGVELTTHNVMKPVKSLSYLLLVGAVLSSEACFIDCTSCVWHGRCKEQERPIAREADRLDSMGKG
jgi:hypothetical protein